jgi:hypothetical protein
MNTVYKVSGGIKDYLVTPWAQGAFKARSYLRARGIDAIVTQYKLIEGQWKRGVTK